MAGHVAQIGVQVKVLLDGEIFIETEFLGHVANDFA